MSIDSNGHYLSAFKQCKLQLRPDYEDSPPRWSHSRYLP